MAGQNYASMKYGSLFGKVSTAANLRVEHFPHLLSTRAVSVGMRRRRRDSMEESHQLVLSVLSKVFSHGASLADQTVLICAQRMTMVGQAVRFTRSKLELTCIQNNKRGTKPQNKKPTLLGDSSDLVGSLTRQLTFSRPYPAFSRSFSLFSDPNLLGSVPLLNSRWR